MIHDPKLVFPSDSNMHVATLQSLVPARFETRTVTGLVKGHAYSVTAVEEVKLVTDRETIRRAIDKFMA